MTKRSDKEDFFDKLKHGDEWINAKLQRTKTTQELEELVERFNLEEWDDDENTKTDPSN